MWVWAFFGGFAVGNRPDYPCRQRGEWVENHSERDCFIFILWQVAKVHGVYQKPYQTYFEENIKCFDLIHDTSTIPQNSVDA